MSKKMVIMSQDMDRIFVMGRGFNAWIRKANDVEFEIYCGEGPYDDLLLGVYPTMTEAKSVMGAVMQVYAHEGGIFYMPKASDAEEEEPEEPEPEEKNPWIPVEEGLPDTVRTVWVSCEQSDAVYSAWHSPISGTWYVTGTHADVYLNVIAWREIDIEPYKKPEND